MKSPALSRAFTWLERPIDWLFQGAVSPWAYAILRVGLALSFLVRHADWLRRWVYLEHHRMVRGLMFLHDGPLPPALDSPMVPGLTFGDGATRWLVYARTALCFLLLFGVRARASALLLALTSYLLLAADRYRYFHHLHLLYLSLGWLALSPLGERLSLETPFRRLFDLPLPARAESSPIWPLQLIRALVLSVYGAAGVSKLNSVWLSGETLRRLEDVRVLGGSTWVTIRDAFGYSGVAWASCATELGLLPLLTYGPTRRFGVLLALGFHVGISASMPVYSFGTQMAVLLISFWVRERRRA